MPFAWEFRFLKVFAAVAWFFAFASCGSEDEERDALERNRSACLRRQWKASRLWRMARPTRASYQKGNQMVTERERFPPATFSRVYSKTVLLTVTDRAFTNPMRKSIATRVCGQAGKKRVWNFDLFGFFSHGGSLEIG